MKKWIESGVKGFILFMITGMVSGCAAVEPEDRVFPMVLGVDYRDGVYQVMYGMPNLSQVTGQNKGDVNGETEKRITIYEGTTLEEARTRYDLSQEKYLDLGHLKVLVVGTGLAENDDRMTELLQYLEQMPSVAGNLYVFSTENLADLMALNGYEIDSLGDYLAGMVENKPVSKRNDMLQLYDLYNAWHNQEEFPSLPRAETKEGEVFLE